MALYNESRSLDVTNLQGAALTRCLRLRLREIVADVREQHNLPHDKPLALKIGGATEDRWRSRSSTLEQYPRGLFHREKFLLVKGGVSDVEGAALEAACISLMRSDEVSGALCINTRLEVPLWEHRNASAARPSSVYMNVVLPELEIETYDEWMVAWRSHQLTTHNPHTLRLDGNDAYSRGTDAFSRGTDAYSLGKDAYSRGTDKCSLGTDKRSLGKDAYSLGKDAFSRGTDAFSRGTDAYSRGTDAYSLGKDAFSRGTDKRSLGTDAVSRGTAKPQTSGADRKQHSYPTSRVHGLDLDALQLAWDEGGLAMPYSLPEMFSAGRRRFNSYLDHIRESSSKLKKLIDSTVCGGQLNTNKFDELRDAFKAAQTEAGTDAADDTQTPPRKKAMLALPPRKQEVEEEGEEEEAGVYLLSTSQLPRQLLIFAPIRAAATWDEIVATYRKCFDEHVSTAVWESGGVRTLVFNDASLAAAKAAFVAAADDSTSMTLRSWSDAESRDAEVDVD